jgi:hypothetical protein
MDANIIQIINRTPIIGIMIVINNSSSVKAADARGSIKNNND